MGRPLNTPEQVLRSRAADREDARLRKLKEQNVKKSVSTLNSLWKPTSIGLAFTGLPPEQ